jgi:hypothetical protein
MKKTSVVFFMTLGIVLVLVGCGKIQDISTDINPTVTKQQIENTPNINTQDNDHKSEVVNKLEGYSWEMKDGSLLELSRNGSFNWYKDKNNKSDNYYSGSYFCTNCLPGDSSSW